MKVRVYLEKGRYGRRQDLVLVGEPTRAQVREVIRLTFGEEYRYRRITSDRFLPKGCKKW